MTSARDKILSVIEATANKTETRRNARKAKGNATSYLLIWNDAVAEHFEEGQVAPTIKSLGLLKRALKRTGNMDVTRNKNFIEWVIANWILIGQTRFSNLKNNYPEYPSLNFFVAGIERYYFAYCAKDKRSVSSSNTDKEAQTLRAKLTKAEEDNKKLQRQLEELTAERDSLKRRIKEMQQTRRSGGLAKWD